MALPRGDLRVVDKITANKPDTTVGISINCFFFIIGRRGTGDEIIIYGYTACSTNHSEQHFCSKFHDVTWSFSIVTRRKFRRECLKWVKGC